MIYKCKQKAAFGDKNTKGISNIQQFIPTTKSIHIIVIVLQLETKKTPFFFKSAGDESQSAKPSVKYIRHLA